jgi:hypothetical protein
MVTDADVTVGDGEALVEVPASLLHGLKIDDG